MRKQTLVFIILSFILYGRYTAIAQPNLPNPIPASPEAGAIAKYINYPVNYGTGLVNINIPLYEIKVGDLVVPISLSYHASGIKVAEESGWVGQGWTLNAEPSVSRSIKGLPDEGGYLLNQPGSNTNFLYYKDLANGIKEETPDMFYYKLLDKSGGFYFHRKDMNDKTKGYSIIPHPYEPIVIKDTTGFKSFNIKDENGINYKFSNIEYFQGAYHASNQWKATKITSSRTNEAIDFTYTTPVDNIIKTLTDVITVQDSLIGYYQQNGCVGVNSIFVSKLINGYVYNFYVANKSQNLVSTICDDLTKPSTGSAGKIISIKLQKITFSNGYVSFITSNNKLQNISVFDKNENKIREIKFSRSFYTNTTTRDKLDKIEILDNKGILVEKYSFNYYSGLPEQTSKDTDHWGYYNGASNSYTNSAIPRQLVRGTVNGIADTDIHFEIGDANREPNHDMIKAGSLKSITYPTGGSTEFEYEGNMYKEVFSDAIIKSSGLRIARIKDYNTDGQLQLSRYFKYGKNEDGLGYAKHEIKLRDYMYEQYMHYAQFSKDPSYLSPDPIFPAQVSYRIRTYVANTIPDLFYSHGSPVAYDYITEYTESQNGIRSGKTVYNYNYYPSSIYLEFNPKTHYDYDIRNDWMEGQLNGQYSYKYDNNAYTLVAKKTFSYTNFKRQQTKVGKVIKIDVGSYADNYMDYPNIKYYNYNIESGCTRLTEETYSEFYPGKEITTVKKHYYDGSSFNMQPIKTETLTSTGGSEIKEFTYPTTNSVLAANNMVSTIIQEITKNNNNETCRIKTNYPSTGMPLPTSVQSSYTGVNGLTTVLTYDLYDSKGNLLQYTAKDGVPVSFVWGYNQQYPIAKVVGATFAQVKSALGQTITSNDLAYLQNYTGSTLTTELKKLRDYFNDNATAKTLKAQVFTYTYQPLVGMTSETDPNNVTTYYEYDSFGRLSRALDNNKNVLKQYEYNYKQ